MAFKYPYDQTADVIRKGDIRVVNLPVKVVFDWSDEIIAEYDYETDTVVKYKSGWVMKVLSDQGFVYKDEPTTYLAQATIESH